MTKRLEILLERQQSNQEVIQKKTSNEVKELQNTKRIKQKDICDPEISLIRTNLISKYKDIQNDIHEQIVKEKTAYIEHKFNQIAADKSRSSFWKEKKRMTKNATLDSLIVKDADGNRLYNPEQIKNRTADYYEELYRHKTRRPHPYHMEVE